MVDVLPKFNPDDAVVVVPKLPPNREGAVLFVVEPKPPNAFERKLTEIKCIFNYETHMQSIYNFILDKVQ